MTPGFWKTHSHRGPAPHEAWSPTGFDPDGSYNDVFDVLVDDDPTLLEALDTGGGGLNALLRHSTAALLNASHPNIDYRYTVDEVIVLTRTAIESGGPALIESTKDLFDWWNNLGADLSGGSSGGGTVTTGFLDANEAPGPSAQIGDAIMFRILVTNTGSMPLDIDVEDTNLPSGELSVLDVSGDENTNGLLDPGEVWVFEYSIIASEEGEFYNLATVIGTPVDSNGTEYGLEPVTDEDPAHWRVFAELGDEDPPGDVTGVQGLTPGFWKQPHHLEYWEGYSPTDSYSSVFGVSLANDVTLVEALHASGGGLDALLRHSVAALLNASHPNIDYAFTTTEVIAVVQDAFATGDYETVKDIFDRENNRGNVDLKSGTSGEVSVDDYDAVFQQAGLAATLPIRSSLLSALWRRSVRFSAG